LTLTAAAAGTLQGAVWGAGTGTTLSQTGIPTSVANATTLGTLSLPAAGAHSSDVLAGTLVFGTETIQLGTTTGNQKTDTMANLAQTINAGNYGVNATLNSAGTSITFTSPDSVNAITSSTPHAWVPGGTFNDATDGAAVLQFNTANNNLTTSAYYSIGISGTIVDTSTGGGTAVLGLSNDLNGSGGVATMSYSDAAGQSLSATDLNNASDAQAALTALNMAISNVAAQDGYIGAMINTLNSVSSVLSTQSENVTSAQNAVQATDYASATSNMSKYEILSQTGIAALAQANSMQQEVTKLLQ
jgi:flagellin